MVPNFQQGQTGLSKLIRAKGTATDEKAIKVIITIFVSIKVKGA